MKVYLFLIAFLVGIEISIGVFLAPVIFNPGDIIGVGVLSKFQSGQLMSRIFIKFGYVLMIISIISFLFELVNLKNRAQIFAKKFSLFMLSSINLALALIFVFYFTDYILKAQEIGILAIETTEFASIHKASEVAMKIMIFAQTILFFLKISELRVRSEG